MGWLRRVVILGATIGFSIVIVILVGYASKIETTYKMVSTYADLCAEISVKAFQDESNMDLYTDYNRNTMSSSYNRYLDWLGTHSEYTMIAHMLRQTFTQGVTPGNYALPYLDETKLIELFQKNLSKQMDAFNSAIGTGGVGLFGVDNVVCKPKIFIYNMREFYTYGKMFGNNSTFSNNTVGHTKLYDYNYYPSYYMEFEVTFDVIIESSMIPGMKREHPQSITVSKTYELFN